MSQTFASILSTLQEARATGRVLQLSTMDKHRCSGTVTAIIPGTVKPFEERSTIVLETAKGPKQILGYSITKVAWVD